MIIKYLFILLLLVSMLLAINQSIKRYAESEIIYLRTQLKLLEAIETLIQVYPDIKPYTTQIHTIKSNLSKKLNIYKPLSQYGLLILFYS